MSTQLNIFILIFGGLQGLLLSLFLFRKKLGQSGYIFLLLYLGVMLLQLTLKVMNKMWLGENWSILYSISHYLPLFYGPMAYFFVKDILSHSHFDKRGLWHFIPPFFIIVIAFMINYKISPVAFEYILFNPHIRLAILSISLISYHYLAYHVWQQHRLSLHNYFSDTLLFQMNWLRSFIWLSFIVCGLVACALYLLYINYPSGHAYRYGFAGLSIFIYWISFTALQQPAIFSVIKGYAEPGIDHIPKLVVYRSVKKYASSTLDAGEKKRICEALEMLVRKDKIYLDAELTIDLLAQKITCSRHALSQVLNECMQQSFYEFINYYRIEEAKILLTDERRKDHKISSIGYDAGFNSLSTFNEVFKKVTGQTPSMFKKQLVPSQHKKRV